MPRTPGSRTPAARNRHRFPAVGAALAVSLAGGALLLPHGAEAAPFTGGNLVVYRVGSGTALTNAAAPVFLDEYSPSGAKVQSVALPTAADTATGNHALTATGQSRSEGLISRSADGRLIALTGYDAAPGATGPGGLSLTASAPTTVGRTVGLVDGNGGFDTSTVLGSATDPSIIRSAATDNGSRLWAAGGNGGLLAQPFGATSHAAITPATGNLNSVTVQGGRLLVSGILTDRLSVVGSGLPSTTASTTPVPGLPDNLLTYGYGLIDATDKGYAGTALDTLYVANASERGGTVDKYSFNGTEWKLAGFVDVPGAFGLVADKNGSAVSLAVTTPTKLVAINDATAGAATFTDPTVTDLASAPTGSEFRGVALAPTATGGPSAFARQPLAGSTVGSAGVPVSVLAPDATGVTAKLGSGAPKALTAGAGGLWTGTVPLGGASSGAGTVTITAKDASGTTTLTRVVRVTGGAPAGTAGTGRHSWTVKPVTRTGTWSTYSTTSSPNGKGLSSAKKGSAAAVKVYGRSVVLTFRRTPTSGSVTVTVDGKATTVSLKGAKGLLSKTWKFSSLKTHTVKVTVAAAKSVGLSSFKVSS